MLINKKSKASLLVAALIIFTFISSILLVLYMYSSNNLKQAKLQEENMHAYFLAYSGCEIAYAALLDEFNEEVIKHPLFTWESFVQKFNDSIFISNHRICISNDAGYSDPDFPDYSRTEFIGPTGSGFDPKTLEDFKNAAIFIKVEIVTDSNMLSGESDYKDYLRIESIAKTGLNSAFPGLSKKYLYVDKLNEGKVYWR